MIILASNNRTLQSTTREDPVDGNRVDRLPEEYYLRAAAKRTTYHVTQQTTDGHEHCEETHSD